MPDPLRHLNAIRAFDAAARHLSMVKAAQELNVSHSVVSQHVKRLEYALGTKLFLRTGNSIALTEHAGKLHQQITQGLGLIRDACTSLTSEQTSTRIVVGAEPTFANQWLRKRLANAPDLDVDILPLWGNGHISDAGVDFAIHFSERFPTNTWSTSALFPIRGFPACSPEFLKRNGADPTLDGLPLIHDVGRHIWQHWYATHVPGSMHWSTGKVYADLSLAASAVLDGEGVFLADRMLFSKEFENGDLVALDQRDVECAWFSLGKPKSSGPMVASGFETWIASQIDA